MERIEAVEFDGVKLPVITTSWEKRKLAPIGEVCLPKGTVVRGRLISTRGGGASWDCPSYLRYGTGRFNPLFEGVLAEDGELRFRHSEEYLRGAGAIWQSFAPRYHSSWHGWIILGKVEPHGPSRVTGLSWSRTGGLLVWHDWVPPPTGRRGKRTRSIE